MAAERLPCGGFFFDSSTLKIEKQNGKPVLTIIQEAIVPKVDNKSIANNDGIISLFGYKSAEAGQMPRMGANGALEWFTPEGGSVQELAAIVQRLDTEVQEIKVEEDTNVYKKSEGLDVSDLVQKTGDKLELACGCATIYE